MRASVHREGPLRRARGCAGRSDALARDRYDEHRRDYGADAGKGQARRTVSILAGLGRVRNLGLLKIERGDRGLRTHLSPLAGARCVVGSRQPRPDKRGYHISSPMGPEYCSFVRNTAYRTMAQYECRTDWVTATITTTIVGTITPVDNA